MKFECLVIRAKIQVPYFYVTFFFLVIYFFVIV